jgi:hypothetical protein
VSKELRDAQRTLEQAEHVVIEGVDQVGQPRRFRTFFCGREKKD